MPGRSSQIKESLIILIAVIFILLLISFKGRAQTVGIGTASPHPSAQLDVSSTSKGMLIPRMTSVQRNAIASPGTGLIVYDTNYGRFWYYTGSSWVDLLSSDRLWQLNGNSGTDTSYNFIGTTDFVPLRFKINNQNVGLIGLNGMIVLGQGSGNGNNYLTNNIGIGENALSSSVVNDVIAIGSHALNKNVNGIENLAIGHHSLEKNISGGYNTAIGNYSLFNNEDGVFNIAVGTNALYNNTSGLNNTAVGRNSLDSNTEGSENTAIGMGSMLNNTTGSTNTAVGKYSMINGLLGNYNVAIGWISLGQNNGNSNTGIGSESLWNNVIGTYNTALGDQADVGNPDLFNATAIGARARVNCSNCMVLGSIEDLYGNFKDVNVGIGESVPGFPLNFKSVIGDKISLWGNTGNHYGLGIRSGLLQIYTSTVGSDIAFGYGSSAAFTETMRVKGNGNVGIGRTNPAFPLSFADNVGDKISLYGASGNHYGFGLQGYLMQIHSDAPGSDIAFGTGGSTAFTENMRIQTLTGNVGIGYNNPSQKLSVNGNICYVGSIAACSDIRYKKNFSTIKQPLAAILSLHGFYYYWKKEEFRNMQFTAERQIGFSAQEVEKLFPELVTTDANGYKSVDYGRMTPVLVEAIKDQQHEIDGLKKNQDRMQKEINELKNLVEKLLKQ